MCRKALKGILKVSERRMKTVETLYSKGISTIATTMSYGKKISQKRTIAYGWFSKFVDNCGDYMPHNGSIHLPHTLSKQMIYQTMKSQLTQQGLSSHDILKPSAFFKMWESDFPNCVIPKVNRNILYKYITDCTTYTTDILPQQKLTFRLIWEVWETIAK